MKAIIKQGFAIAMIAVAAFILVLNGCKKADLKPAANDNNINIDAERAKAAKLIEKEGGIPQIFTRNQPVQTYWGDQNRKPVSIQQMQSSNITSQCSYNNPSFCNLVQYARVYACADGTHSAGYYLQFEFEMSWDNNVILDNGGGNLTTGYAEVVDGSSNIVQSLSFDYTNSDVQIVDMGPDPDVINYPNNEIFRVKFVTTQNNPQLVPEMYINSTSYAVRFSALFVSDCKFGGGPYSLWTIPVTSYGFTGANGDDPCERNDKAWVTTMPSGGSTMVVAGYNGVFSYTCGYGGSFVAPDLQEVEYNVDGTGWQSMDNYTANSGWQIFGSAFIRGNDLCRTGTLPSTPGSHMVVLRYRNFKYNTSPPSNWPLPTGLNTLCKTYPNTSLPSGQQDYSSWAYQYWPY